MRGKVACSTVGLVPARITPAYAGKRNMNVTPYFLPWDHPRLCGEKWLSMRMIWYSDGSPPPMRGKAQAAVWTELSIRITPAYAGKSGGEKECQPCTRDHPRLCGEKLSKFLLDMLPQGSPPPMRGKD